MESWEVLNARPGGLDFTLKTMGDSELPKQIFDMDISALGKGIWPHAQIWGLTPGGRHDS